VMSDKLKKSRDVAVQRLLEDKRRNDLHQVEMLRLVISLFLKRSEKDCHLLSELRTNNYQLVMQIYYFFPSHNIISKKAVAPPK
jgi:hypothetical protein